jgi:hypothetical protein
MRSTLLKGLLSGLAALTLLLGAAWPGPASAANAMDSGVAGSTFTFYADGFQGWSSASRSVERAEKLAPWINTPDGTLINTTLPSAFMVR